MVSTIVLILIFSIWGRGFVQIAILIIIGGTVGAAVGLVPPVQLAKLAGLNYQNSSTGTPRFEWTSIASMSLAASHDD